jgi:tetratricopeptide (TPR) repeat protein
MPVPVLPSSPVASGGAPGGQRPAGPVRAGLVPALADGFCPREEAVPGLSSALIPGALVALVPERSGEPGRAWPPGRSAAGQAGGTGDAGVIADWASVTGKTQIAVAFAHSLHRSGATIIWADASSRASVLASYATAAVALGGGPGRGADAAARHLLTVLAEAGQPWLVVLDGLRDPADIESLIPRGPAGMTLITTADVRLIPGSWHAEIAAVSPFSAREAMSYVRGRLTSDSEQRVGMIGLVTEIGGEPAALAQASGVVAASRMSCREFADVLIIRREQMARGAGAVPPVAAVTFALAVERAHQFDGAAWPALTIAAMLDGQRIPSAVFDTSVVARYMTGEPEPAASATAGTLRLLAQVGLVSVDAAPDGPVVRISQPVSVAVRTALSRDDHDRALATAVSGVTEAWPDDEPPVLLGCMLASCSVSLWRAARDRLWADGNCPPLLRRAGDFLISAGMLGPALAFWDDLAATAERLLAPDHPDALMIAGRIAGLHLAGGEPARAVPFYERIFNQLARRFGADHAAPIAARLDVGRALTAAGQFDEAVAVLDLAAAGYELVLGRDHLDTLAATEQLAAACGRAGAHARAITLYQRALADRLRLQGARHPDAIAARQRLAGAYLAAGDAKAAISHGKQVVADRRRELGEDHLDTVAAIGDLGAAHRAAGRAPQAVQLLEQARAGYERILGADHPETLACRVHLVRAYNALGWIGDAAVLLHDTAQRCDRVLPPGDPLTLAVRELLASAAGRGR